MSPGADATDVATTLVGREREMYAIGARLDAVSERGVAELVRGEAGVGNSVLLTAERDRAESADMGVLAVSGVRSEARVPFAALHQLLHRVQGLARPQRDALLATFGMEAECLLRASSGTVVKSQRMRRLNSSVTGGRSMIDVVLKRFEQPDEIREFAKGKLEIVQLGELTIGRATYEPGWKWSEHVGPDTGSSRCRVEHIGLVVTGTATAAFDDGHVFELRPGDLFHIPPEPHDSWVVGDQPYVSLHFLGADSYAT